MFEFEIDFATRQAKDARYRAPSAEGEKARADWLTIARMWERLVDHYSSLERLDS